MKLTVTRLPGARYYNMLIEGLGMLTFALLIILSGCQKSQSDKMLESWKKSGVPGNLNITYPLNNTLFPPEIAPPTFLWEDQTRQCGVFMAVVESAGETLFTSSLLSEPRWTPNSRDWEEIKSRSVKSPARVTILGCRRDGDNLIAGSQVNIRTSSDQVGAPVFFRTVTLPFGYAVNNLETISWRLGNVSSTGPAPVMLENMPVCANCHSFSSDGKVMGMDVDYANDKGSFAVADIPEKSADVMLSLDKIISWSDFRREDGRKTFGLLSNVSPDGRYIASTVKDRSIFVAKNDEYYSQLFFPIKGIIAVYDRVEKKYISLKGADDPACVQSNPVWSPDGKFLLFSKAKAFDCPEAEKSKKAVLPVSVAKDFIEGKQRFYFDIYKIPFNGGAGGQAVPLAGASGNGMSNFFPKFSPDGKWVVFTQSKNFMLLQPDSKLYIIPSEGGQPRLMSCNTGEMNSWHSFSPNGRWLVFSSKARGPYTRLFMTHIDEKGNDTPPVCLEYMTPEKLAANIPEFVNISPERKLRLVENFMHSDYYAEARIGAKSKSGDFKGAVAELKMAISKDPANHQLYLDKALIEEKLGNAKAALEDLNACIKLNGNSDQAYYERGYLKIDAEDYKSAIEDFNKSFSLNSRNYLALFQIAVSKYYLNDFNGSISDCNSVIKLDPGFADSYFQRGLCYIKLGQNDNACEDLKKAQSLGSRYASQVIQDYCGGL